MKIKSEIIEEAIYNLCKRANVNLCDRAYEKIRKAYRQTKNKENKDKFARILKNADIANRNSRPLCQDTGNVIVFLKIGQGVIIEGENINFVINRAVEKCYFENYFRKSICKDVYKNRENTNTNTPIIIHIEIIEGKNIEIDVLIKGAGCENLSFTEMMKPTSNESEIIDYIVNRVIKTNTCACPPLFLGIGIGSTFDWVSVLAKKSFFDEPQENEKSLRKKILEAFNEKREDFVLDVCVKSYPTHIACLPISVSINCHSLRHNSCKIINNRIYYKENKYKKENIEIINDNYIKIDAQEDIETIRNLKKGENVLLTGLIYTIRDVAHKRFIEYYNKYKEFPMDIKNKIIFYAGPCPNTPNEVIGPIGPTTSNRMDKYTPILYDCGLLATIGKGNRSYEVENSIIKNSGIYFTTLGGTASLLSSCVKTSDVILYSELQSESVHKLFCENMPIKVEISKY